MLGNHIQPDPQAIRPNSLELQSSYFNRQQVPYAEGTKPQYPPPPPAYTEHPISPQQHYPPPPYAATPERPANSPSGTPTRNIYRINSLRPSQPPPAPPPVSGSSSGSSTPTVSAGTPSSGGSRYRNHAQRDNLPPPPPPPAAEPLPKEKESRNFDPFPVVSPKAKSPPVENGESHSPKSVASDSGKASSEGKSPPDRVSEDKPGDEVDLPPPPPLPQNGVENSNEKKPVSPVAKSHPPPPPPPPLPPLEDLIMDMAENCSISESQNMNMEVVSITSESASETSSVSKFSEQFEGKKSGHNDGRSDLLQAIREGIVLLIF